MEWISVQNRSRACILTRHPLLSPPSSAVLNAVRPEHRTSLSPSVRGTALTEQKGHLTRNKKTDLENGEPRNRTQYLSQRVEYFVTVLLSERSTR